MKKFSLFFHVCILLFIGITLKGHASDWPMWRYNAGRSACSPQELPRDLDLLWTREYSPRDDVWDDPLNQDLMPYDRVFEPIVMGHYMFIGFNDCDKVVALDTETGEEKWRFYVDGPVRLPMAGWEDKLFFTSDDGFIYCVKARSGELIWKFQGAPSDRKILGNKRLISSWPARGGVVVKDDVVYFAASIWPFMGTFIYALDAESGEIVWRNEGTSAQYIKQPHNSPAYAGVAPQGAMVIGGDRLLIPGGRSVPACYDLTTGDFIYYHLAEFRKDGGSFVCANEKYFFNHTRDRVTSLYDLEKGNQLIGNIGRYPVLAKDVFYFSGESITARDAKFPDDELWELDINASGDLIMAGSRLYAAQENHITAIQLSGNGVTPEKLWTKDIRGKFERLIAADDKLFAVTLDGRIMAFGAKKQTERRLQAEKKSWKPSLKVAEKAQSILDETNVKEGYALFYGLENSELLAALALNSNLHIIAIDPNQQKVNKLRRWFDDKGLLGEQLSLICGNPANLYLPPYIASLTVIGDKKGAKLFSNEQDIQRLYSSIRPYGGKLWIPFDSDEQDQIISLLETLKLPGLKVQKQKNSLVISRNGPLPGSSDWNHQYGNMANTVKSDDRVVKLPLGLLWFGGNSNMDILPRHGHGPPEQIVGGRLIIQGMDCISARDVYTGRVLWKTNLDSLDTFGVYFNESYKNTPLVVTYNQEHMPGANGRGTNFVATEDFVYVVQASTCFVLDAVTGRRVKTISIPPVSEGSASEWGYIGVSGDNLVGGSEFVRYSTLIPADPNRQKTLENLSPKKQRSERDYENYDITASKMLVVMDRYTGHVKWKIKAKYGFIHNAITAGNGKIYCLDKIPAFSVNKMARRGLIAPDDYRLLALDAESGKILWEQKDNIFGSWLSYSKEHDLLLQATRPSRDMLRGEEGKRMIVYKASDGTKLWDKELSYNNPPILHGDQIITEKLALNIVTGETIFRNDPVTRQDIPWTYTRTHGCNYNIASENLLSFRSAAAGFYNLANNGGTGNFGGFKSGCTSNLIAANGVLNAPDYTRTCQCSYQNQTSLGLVYMPELEYWTNSDNKWDGEPVKRIGININAPGDRIADNGTLWLDYPSIGGTSPDIPITLNAENPDYIRLHSLSLKSGDMNWVAASGISAAMKMDITLSEKRMENVYYTIRLHFAELESKKVGERVFNVILQDQKVLYDFDITKEAGGPGTSIIKEFQHIKVQDLLSIQCIPFNLSSGSLPVLCGVEIEMED